jgi:serine/threonine protein kinase
MHHYEIINEIYSGVGIKVNLCKKNGKLVVVKELVDENYFYYLNKEILILEKIGFHENIVNIREAFIFGKKIYAEYEFYDKGDLYDHIKNNGVFDEAQAINLLNQIISALIHSKNCGYYHCDVKPENILLRNFSEFVLSDWDLARKIDDSSRNLVYGSSLSMPPEVILGQHCETSDVYSLGCLLYFCLFGKRIFNLKTSTKRNEVIIKHLKERVVIDGNKFSNEFKKLLSLMFQKNPKERIKLDEISDFLKGKEIKKIEDSINILQNVESFISKENIKKNIKKSLEKYKEKKEDFKKTGNEKSKDEMLSHLIALKCILSKSTQTEIIREIDKEDINFFLEFNLN